MFLMPTVNGLFGALDRKTHAWHPAKGHEKIFTWLATLMRSYESERERKLRTGMSEFLTDILKKTED
jgi:hypothetical protein